MITSTELIAALMADIHGALPSTVADIIHRPAWMNDAACAGRDDIDWTDPKPTPAVLAICWACPVVNPCNLYAIRNHEVGTWGGQGERARLGRRRNPLIPKVRPTAQAQR